LKQFKILKKELEYYKLIMMINFQPPEDSSSEYDNEHDEASNEAKSPKYEAEDFIDNQIEP
jgi:hypothetical protein